MFSLYKDEKYKQIQNNARRGECKSSIKLKPKNRDVLICNYRNRLLKFMESVKCSDFKFTDSYDHTKTPDKMDLPIFKFTHKYEKDKIKEAVNQSKILDLTPLDAKPTRFQFRERDKSKDIGPEMRFQPKNNVERMLDFINTNGIAQLQESHFPYCQNPLYKKSQKIFMRSIHKNHNYSTNKESPNEKMQISTMNTLKMSPMELFKHEKEHTHYRAIQSIFNNDISKLILSVETEVTPGNIGYTISL